MTARRRWSIATLVLIAVVAFAVAFACGWALPFPWGALAGLVAASGIGWYGGRVLYRVRHIERAREHDQTPP